MSTPQSCQSVFISSLLIKRLSKFIVFVGIVSSLYKSFNSYLILVPRTSKGLFVDIIQQFFKPNITMHPLLVMAPIDKMFSIVIKMQITLFTCFISPLWLRPTFPFHGLHVDVTFCKLNVYCIDISCKPYEVCRFSTNMNGCTTIGILVGNFFVGRLKSEHNYFQNLKYIVFDLT